MKMNDSLYMDIARRVSMESYCVRKQVGAVLVTPALVTMIGYNGTASGDDNICEILTEDGLITKPEVLHAESNVFSKALRAGVSTNDSVMYVTLAPCIHCAKMIYQSGVKRVVYLETYGVDGINFLTQRGVNVVRYQDRRTRT